jgi:outer membrane biosynthesis protein TonB
MIFQRRTLWSLVGILFIYSLAGDAFFRPIERLRFRPHQIRPILGFNGRQIRRPQPVQPQPVEPQPVQPQPVEPQPVNPQQEEPAVVKELPKPVEEPLPEKPVIQPPENKPEEKAAVEKEETPKEPQKKPEENDDADEKEKRAEENEKKPEEDVKPNEPVKPETAGQNPETIERVYTKNNRTKKESFKQEHKKFAYDQELTKLPINPDAPKEPSEREKLFNEIYPKLQQSIGRLKQNKTSKVECFEVRNFCAPAPLHCYEEAFDEHRCYGGCRSCDSCFDVKSLNFEKVSEKRFSEVKPLFASGGKESNMAVSSDSYKAIFNQVVNTYKCKACVREYYCHPNVCKKNMPPTCVPV